MWDVSIRNETKILVAIPIAILIALWIKWRLNRAIIEHLPGPMAIPFFGNFIQIATSKMSLHEILVMWADKYGGLFRTYAGATPVILLTKPEYLKTFYLSTTMLEKSHHYMFALEFMGNGMFLSGGKKWKGLRRNFLSYFSATSVEIWKTNFMKSSKELLSQFKNNADGSFFSCGPILQCVSGNSIFMNTCGEKIPEAEESSLLESLESVMRVLFLRCFSILHHFDFTFYRTTNGKAFRKAIAYFDSFVRNFVHQKKLEMQDMEKKGSALPDLYIYKLLENHSDEPMDFHVNEMKTLIITGQDTTAGTIGYILIILGLYPEVQQKVFYEDQQIQKALHGREFHVEDLQQYQYLDRVIKETLRIFPIAPMVGRTLGEDTYFGKYLVPKGTDVVVMQNFVNRNPKIFPDPLRFDPDRHLPENLEKIPPYAFNPFSAGPRSCPGMRYAMVSMKMLVPTLVRHFRIISKYKDIQEALNNMDTTFVLKDKQNYPIRLVTRA